MQPKEAKGSIFTSNKPKSFPWFYVPVIISIAALVIIYNLLKKKNGKKRIEQFIDVFFF